MDFKSFEFCILKNPFSKIGSEIIFVATKGTDIPSDNVLSNHDYESLVYVLTEKYDMIQIDTYAFTFPDNYVYDLSLVRQTLEKLGLNYNNKFEVNMKDYFFELENELRDKGTLDLAGEKLYSIPLKSSIKKYNKNVPEVGEKVTLFFYCFLKANFVDETNCFIEFSGDFLSKENKSSKNYIKIFGLDFIRIENNFNDEIIFQSKKTFQDILKKIPINFHGFFELKYPSMDEEGIGPYMKNTKYIYNFFDQQR